MQNEKRKEKVSTLFLYFMVLDFDTILCFKMFTKHYCTSTVPGYESESVNQPCPAFCNPIDGSPPGSSIPGILQAIILEWVATPSTGDLCML